MEWSLHCLSFLKPHFFFSRSNPHHAILIAQCLQRSFGLAIDHSAAPDYLLVQPEVDIQTHIPINYEAVSCISNLQFQSGRRRLVKKLLCNPYILDRIHLFDFMPESDFRHLLLSSLYLLIPSINGQISPQIFYALSNHCLPIVDCFAALNTSCYHRFLASILVSLDSTLLALSVPPDLPDLSEFLVLSKQLFSIAHSEVSFVRLYLSSNQFLRRFFTLSHPIAPLTSSVVSLSPHSRVHPTSQFVLSHLDQLKLLSLREPFLLHRVSLVKASQALSESVLNSDLQFATGLSIDVINESRQWLYH